MLNNEEITLTGGRSYGKSVKFKEHWLKKVNSMNTEIKAGYPSEVFGGDVVVVNPATKDKGATIDAEASKLPNKEKEAFLSTVLAKMWGEIEIIAAAADCVRFKAGDKVLGTPESMKSATVTPDGQFLIINERTFKGKW